MNKKLAHQREKLEANLRFLHVSRAVFFIWKLIFHPQLKQENSTSQLFKTADTQTIYFTIGMRVQSYKVRWATQHACVNPMSLARFSASAIGRILSASSFGPTVPGRGATALFLCQPNLVLGGGGSGWRLASPGRGVEIGCRW